MKGLLLKDFYMTKKYCKSYLLIAAIFIVLSLVNEDNLFFVFYPCLLCGMIPVTLLGYDERSRWMQYSGTLPYTKGQIVSCKYLIGLMAQMAMLLVTGIAQAVKMNIDGTFQLNDYMVLMLIMLILAMLTSSISLPFIFKLGVEKGRAAYYVMVGVVCAGSIVAANFFKAASQMEIQRNGMMPLLGFGGIGIYALSWYLSIIFYKKREIN